jgi:hypothetical protein
MPRSRHRNRRRRRKTAGNGPLRKVIVAVIVGALLLGAFIAWVSTRPVTGENQEAVCALLIDRTASFQDATIEARRRSMAANAVDGCRERKARMTVSYFDQASQKLVVLEDKDGTTLFDLWLPEGRKSSVQERELEGTLERARAVAESAFDRPTGDSRGSDIITAMRAAATDLNSRARQDGVNERFLIVLTDGLQTSSGLTVQDLATPEAPVEPLVAKASELGLIPQLDGVYVNLVGVRTGVTADGSQLEQFFEAKVQEFWEAVVTAGGGSLCLYEPDASRIPVDC